MRISDWSSDVCSSDLLPSTCILNASYRYGWDARALGLMMAATGVCSIIVQAALVRPIVARLGERRTLLTGLIFAKLGFSGFGLAPPGPWFLAAVPVFALVRLVIPACQELMTVVGGRDE